MGYGHIAANCPSKRNMFMHNGIVMSEHDSDSPGHSSHSRASSENQSESPLEGDFLVVRRLLGQVSQPFDESQRENIFHTRCLIQNNICSLIVDEGSCTNVASTRVVKKLALPTISHTKPYKLQWLSTKSEIMVNKQVLIKFAIGKYKNEVLILPVDLAQERCLVTIFLTSLTPRALQVRSTDSLSENLKNTQWGLCGRWRSDAQVRSQNHSKNNVCKNSV